MALPVASTRGAEGPSEERRALIGRGRGGVVLGEKGTIAPLLCGLVGDPRRSLRRNLPIVTVTAPERRSRSSQWTGGRSRSACRSHRSPAVVVRASVIAFSQTMRRRPSKLNAATAGALQVGRAHCRFTRSTVPSRTGELADLSGFRHVGGQYVPLSVPKT
jgi:hypothetical protein